MHKLYDQDFYLWAKETAAAIRSGRIAEVDLENVAEEIEGLANRDYREVYSRLRRILEHKLKLCLVRGIFLDRNRHGWETSVRTQQDDLRVLLEASPSLRRHIPELISKAYGKAVGTVTALLDRPAPPQCPWTVDEILG
jgi:hypothetical protein